MSDYCPAQDAAGWEWMQGTLEQQWIVESEMEWIVRTTESADFERPEPGTYGAALARIIDLGTQDTNFGPKRLVRFQWELDEKMSGDGRPFLVTKRYTLSLNAKANLRKDIESWRGKSYGDDAKVPISALLGQPCMLTLSESEDGKYINVTGVSKLPKGMTPYQPETDLLMFHLDAPDWSVFDLLHEKTRELIAQSPEYREAKSGGKRQTEQVAEMATDDAPDDDIPF